MKKYLLLLFLLLGVVASKIVAQTADPLNKPELWAKLQHNPNDQTLWEKYVGKPLAQLTAEDKNSISKWQELLIMLQAEHADIVITSTAETNALDEEVLRDMQAADWENLEEMVMGTSSEIKEMRNNIEENFALLEDLYAELFAEQGLTYVTYAKTYPKANVSKTAFIEEQEAKLREVKMKELQALRRQIIKN